jgi:hypothetical protein
MLQATGLASPSDLKLQHIMRRLSEHDIQNLADLMPSLAEGALLQSPVPEGLFAKYWHLASADHFQLQPISA